MSVLTRAVLMAASLGVAGCAPPPPPEPPDTRAADEAAIRAAIGEWSASAQAKDAEKFASFYADNGVLRLENAPDPAGKAAIREVVGGLMRDPSFALSFAPSEIVVARSSDLAYETGTYSLTVSDAAGKPATQRGHYVVVWQKQADGAWKVVQDVPVSDPPQQP